MVLTLIRPFMKSEIIQKVSRQVFRSEDVSLKFMFQIHLHHGTNYDELHKNVVPRSCLPSDFGGDLKSAEELHKEHVKEFIRLRNYFIHDEKEANLLIQNWISKPFYIILITQQLGVKKYDSFNKSSKAMEKLF